MRDIKKSIVSQQSTIDVFVKLKTDDHLHTDISETEKSGRIWIIAIAAAVALTAPAADTAVFVVLVAVVDGSSKTDTTAALSYSHGVEGVTVWQAVGRRRKPQVTIALQQLLWYV